MARYRRRHFRRSNASDGFEHNSIINARRISRYMLRVDMYGFDGAVLDTENGLRIVGINKGITSINLAKDLLNKKEYKVIRRIR